MSKLTKTIVAVVATMALVFGLATAAYASLPAGTTVTGNLKSGTKMTFKGDIDSVPITVTCTTFTVTGKVPSPASGHHEAFGSPDHQWMHRLVGWDGHHQDRPGPGRPPSPRRR